MRAAIALASLLVALWLGGCGGQDPVPPDDGPTPIHISVPGFPVMPVPGDNPTTVEGVELGRHLFFDPILSGDSTMSCASCHQPQFAFSDPLPLSIGIRGLTGTRNAPSLANAGWNLANFWEGRAQTLEQQALEPVPNHVEMDLMWPEAEARVRRNPRYPPMFEEVFGTPDVDRDRIVKAIAQFERTLVSADSRYDRFLRDRANNPLTPAEMRGFAAFFTEKADCFHCHLEVTTNDFDFQNNGLDSIFADPGRYAVTGDPLDFGRFKTPALRNVALTAPYMHDGRFATLEEVIDHYHHGAVHSPGINPFIRTGNDTLQMNAADKADLLAFLHAMTDSSFINNRALRSPFE